MIGAIDLLNDKARSNRKHFVLLRGYAKKNKRIVSVAIICQYLIIPNYNYFCILYHLSSDRLDFNSYFDTFLRLLFCTVTDIILEILKIKGIIDKI